MTVTRTERVHRPRDRKQRIVTVAAELFRDRGYHNVSLADVAAAVNITAPALYRHFRNKQDLLRQAVDHGLDDLDATLTAAATIDEFITARARMARERHSLAALWQREARHLPEGQRTELRRRVNQIEGRLVALIEAARPRLADADADLLAWALLSVYSSFSVHRITLRRRDVERLLLRISRVVITFPMVRVRRRSVDAAAAGAPNHVTLPRREQLLTSAIRLIDERGYQSVNMNDIGAAVGIAGPSIYKHYPAKSDLLVAALVRGYERLRVGMTQAVTGAADPVRALERLVRAQISYARENRSLIGILISERDELPERDRQRTYRVQRDILDTWVRALDDASPGLTTAEARVTVNVLFAVINNLIRTPRLAARPDLDDQLAALGMAIMTAR